MDDLAQAEIGFVIVVGHRRSIVFPSCLREGLGEGLSAKATDITGPPPDRLPQA
jgi:hypothetical protein